MVLECKNIAKSYNEGPGCVKVIENLSITFPIAGCVYLKGSSGSGKSTLLNLLGSIETPDQGHITLNGRPVNQIGDYLQDYVALVHQRANLLSFLSAQANITLACSLKKVRFDQKRYQKLLSSLDLVGHDHKFPDQLSFGMCQRFSLIQAMLVNSPIILLDEPTGSVDKKSAQIIKKTIRHHQKDHLFVIATHDQSLVDNDQVIDFDELLPAYHFNHERYGLVQKNPQSASMINFYSWRQFLSDWKKALLIIISQMTIATSLMVMMVLFFEAAAFYQASLENNPYNQIITVEASGPGLEGQLQETLASLDGIASVHPYLDLNSQVLKSTNRYLDVLSFQLNPRLNPATITTGRAIGKPDEILVNQALVDQGVNLETVVTGVVNNTAYHVVGVVQDQFNQLPSVYFQNESLVQSPKDFAKVNLVVEDYTRVDEILAKLDHDYRAYSDFVVFKNNYATLLILSGLTGAFFIIVALLIGIILYSLVQNATFYDRHQDNCLLLLLGLKKRHLFFNMLKESLIVGAVISLLGLLMGLKAVALVKQADFLPDFLTAPLDLASHQLAGVYGLMVAIYGLVALAGALGQVGLIKKLKIAEVLKEE